jgi:hypothetical protein
MDTSRGPDGPIDSRPDRQLRPMQGRHIMMWRQTWRQMWYRGGDPRERHHHRIDMTAKGDLGVPWLAGAFGPRLPATVPLAANGSRVQSHRSGAP